MKVFLGIDVGSVSTNLVLVGEGREILDSVYLRTRGQPISALQEGLEGIEQSLPSVAQIAGVATTGSGRQLAGALVGADLIKNEITS
ncbi:MAG: 2-hydroxyglutaryl-CoA dehydratase, partial [candidate division NC10 bacterium]|nr:2-hydroxyglutaryl-CoA dehydratase [candidate division NC10 bacterium]